MKRWFATMLLMCLLLPVAALAVTEGAVEDAPMVTVDGMSLSQEAAVSYLPDIGYYADYGEWEPNWADSETWVESEFAGEIYVDAEQRPMLTTGEAKRARALLAAYQAGEIAYEGENILNKMEDVIVGVYALDPADYDGERAFVLLQGPCMTDEQLLAVIDAFAQLGMTFDPDALSYRNCARGGGLECSRFFTEEESERYALLANLIERGVLDASAYEDTAVVRPTLDRRYYCGMEDFTLRPYRMMTDEELCAMLTKVGIRNMTDELNIDELEKQSRQVLNRLGCPLTMNLEFMYYEGGYTPKFFDADCNEGFAGDSRRAYGANFTYHTAEGILVYADTMYDWETGELVSASAMHAQDWMPGDEKMDVTDAMIADTVAGVEKDLGLDQQEWHVRDMQCVTNWGDCIMVCAKVEDGLWLTVYIGQDDGQAHGLVLESGTQVDVVPDSKEPVNG